MEVIEILQIVLTCLILPLLYAIAYLFKGLSDLKSEVSGINARLLNRDEVKNMIDDVQKNINTSVSYQISILRKDLLSEITEYRKSHHGVIHNNETALEGYMMTLKEASNLIAKQSKIINGKD